MRLFQNPKRADLNRSLLSMLRWKFEISWHLGDEFTHRCTRRLGRNHTSPFRTAPLSRGKGRKGVRGLDGKGSMGIVSAPGFILRHVYLAYHYCLLQSALHQTNFILRGAITAPIHQTPVFEQTWRILKFTLNASVWGQIASLLVLCKNEDFGSLGLCEVGGGEWG